MANIPASLPSPISAPNREEDLLKWAQTLSATLNQRFNRVFPLAAGSIDDGQVLTRKGGLVVGSAPGGASFASPTITFASTYGAGVAATTIRSDAVLKFPQALMPTSGGTDTLTLTQSGVDLTLTSSNSGFLKIAATGGGLILPKWTTAGDASGVAVGNVLNFSALSSAIGDDLKVGVNASVAIDSGSGRAADHFGGYFELEIRSGAEFTAADVWGCRSDLSFLSTYNAVSTFDNIYGHWIRWIAPRQTITNLPSNPNITVTNIWGLRVENANSLGGVQFATITNARGLEVEMPPCGGTMMRGVHISKSPSALIGVGTPTDEEAIYIDDLVRGTTTRSTIRWKGHTTGTPTNSHGFFQETAHAVGTNRYSINVLNAAVIGNPSGISQDVLTLNQLNTGAVAGAHILFNDKAGDPSGLTAGQLWRNATKLKFYEGTLTHDLNPLTTKGDIIVHNGTIEIRLPVGANGLQLTADSTQASGLKWDAAGGSGSAEFADNLFRIVDDGDATKKLAFEVAGITTATTRTRTVLDADGAEVLYQNGGILDNSTLRPAQRPVNVTGTNSVNLIGMHAAVAGSPPSIQPMANGSGDTSIGLTIVPAGSGAAAKFSTSRSDYASSEVLSMSTMMPYYFAGAM